MRVPGSLDPFPGTRFSHMFPCFVGFWFSSRRVSPSSPSPHLPPPPSPSHTVQHSTAQHSTAQHSRPQHITG
eukprot:8347154-Pyramimonas_sp.AAC.1